MVKRRRVRTVFVSPGRVTKRRRVRRISTAGQRTIVSNVRTGGFMGIEKKFVDYTVSNDPFTSVWAGGEMEDATALSLSAVAQGDGESQRDGRMYTIHSVFVKGFLRTASQESQTAPITDAVARLALVWDKQTNGAQLNAEDVFDTVTAGEDVNSVKNLQFSHRFRVLKDITIPLPVQNTNEGAINLFASSPTLVPFKMGFTFKTPIQVRCTGTTAAIASIQDNSIHLIGTATDTNVTLWYRSRVRFMG